VDGEPPPALPNSLEKAAQEAAEAEESAIASIMRDEIEKPTEVADVALAQLRDYPRHASVNHGFGGVPCENRVEQEGMMHPSFAVMAERSLHPSYERLVAASAFTGGALPRTMPASGVCLFTEAGCHLYVGRSNGMRKRYARHSNPGATHRNAAFALSPGS
jgi:hypothetical protein